MSDWFKRVLIVVCAALTRRDGRVLVQKRPTHGRFAGLWEFPGGKVEAGERPAQALVRELAEELAIGVDEDDLVPLSFAADEDSLLLLLYRCRRWIGTPRLLHASALDWLAPRAMRDLAMPPADRPLVETLIALAA